MNILITSAGQRVSLVRAFQNELNLFNGGKVYTVDQYPELAPACHVSDGNRKISSVLSPNYIEDLLSICSSLNISLVVPTIDTELLLLSQNLDKFESRGINLIISNSNFIDICRDKRKTSRFFIDNGIDVPKILDKEDYCFPLYIKPYDGSLSKDNYVIHKEGDLTDYHRTNSKLIFMEYISPYDHDEFTVDVYYNRLGILKCAVPRQRLKVRSGEVLKAITKKNLILELIIDKLSVINGARGCQTMQFFLSKTGNDIFGIEINPRFGGGYPLSYFAGANYPGWLIQEYMNDAEVNFYNEWEEDLLMLRYDGEVIVSNG